MALKPYQVQYGGKTYTVNAGPNASREQLWDAFQQQNRTKYEVQYQGKPYQVEAPVGASRESLWDIFQQQQEQQQEQQQQKEKASFGPAVEQLQARLPASEKKVADLEAVVAEQEKAAKAAGKLVAPMTNERRALYQARLERDSILGNIEDVKKARGLVQTRGAYGTEESSSALARGAGQLQSIFGAGKAMLADVLPEGTIDEQKAARDIVAGQAKAVQAARTKEEQEVYERFQKAPSIWESLKILGANPSLGVDIALESLPASAPTLGLGLAGGVAGAYSGGPLGALIGARGGASIGTGLGSFATEYGSALLTTMQKAGVDINDPKAVEAAMNNPKIMEEAHELGFERGIPVAIFDALSAGLAGKMGGSQTIRRFAPLGSSRLRTAAAATAGAVPETLAQGVLGGAGEAAAQLVSEGKISSPSSIVAEAAGELVPGAGETAVGTTYEMLTGAGTKSAQAQELRRVRDKHGDRPLQTIKVNVNNPDDPAQVIRQDLQILDTPDESGQVTVRRPNGMLAKMSMESLEKMAVPETGFGAFQPPEAFNPDNIRARLETTISGMEDVGAARQLVEALTNRLSNDIILGSPQESADFISKKESGLGKGAAGPQAKAKIALVNEAKSILNDYRVEYARSVAQPGAQVGEAAPAPTGTLQDMLERNAQLVAQDRTKRLSLLDQIGSNPQISDKLQAFSDALEENGLTDATFEETAALRDQMRIESDLETAAGKETEAKIRQTRIARMDIIEGVLADKNVPSEEKLDRINDLLHRAELPIIRGDSRQELTTIFGREAANAVFGPKGEYEQKRGAAAQVETQGEEGPPVTREPTPTAVEEPAVEIPTTEVPATEGPSAPTELAATEPAATGEPNVEGPVPGGTQPSLPAVGGITQPVGAAPELTGTERGGVAAGETPAGGPDVRETEAPAPVEAPPPAPPAPPAPPVIDDQFPSNPNRSRADSVGLAASMMKWLRPYSDTILRKINYKYQDVVRFAQLLAEAYGVDSLPENMDIQEKFALYESRKSGNQMRLYNSYMKPIIEEMKRLELDPQDVGMYLWARSAPARNKLVAARSAQYEGGAGSGLTDAEAQAIMNGYAVSGLAPALEKIAKMHDDLVDVMLNTRVKAGLLSRADAAAFRKAQPFYTPLKGFAADGDMQTEGDPDPHSEKARTEAEKKRKGVRASEFVRSTGRKSMPFNPLFNLMADAQYAVQRAEINRVGSTFLKILQNDPIGMENVAKVYDMKNNRYLVRRTDPDTNETKMVAASIQEMNRMAANGEFLVVKKDGVPYYIKFEEGGKNLERAFNNMTPEEAGVAMRVWTASMGILKSTLTRWNPVYTLTTAPFRDLGDVIATAFAAQNIKGGPALGKKLGRRTSRYAVSPEMWVTVKNYVAGNVPENAEQQELYLLLDQMVEDGGGVVHAMFKDAESFAQDAAAEIKRNAAARRGNPLAVTVKGVEAVGGLLDATAQVVDLIGRFATYRAATELGISRDNSASLALDSSLNLTRRGEWSRVLDNLIPFFSAAVEGGRKYIKMISNPKTALKVMGLFVALGALEALWNSMRSGDKDDDGEPDYKDINTNMQRTRMNWYYGSGPDDYITIPLGFMLGYPKYVGQKLMEGFLIDPANGRDFTASVADATADLAIGMAAMFSPVRPSGGDIDSVGLSFMPFGFKQYLEGAANRNNFGTPIYTEQFAEDIPPSEIGREDTGKFWKSVARAVNRATGGSEAVKGEWSWQPERFRYLFESMTNGSYKFGEDLVTFLTGEAKGEGIRKVPLAKQFFGRGAEFAPITKYKANTAKMPYLARAYENADEEKWAEEKRRFPLETRDDVIEAYINAQKQIADIQRFQKESLAEQRLPAQRRKIIEDYRKEKDEVYKEFNRVYGAAKKELERK